MNIISRITHRTVSSLFSRIAATKNTEGREIHSLCNKAASGIGGNEQQTSLHSKSLLQPRLPILQQFCGMKYKVRLRLRCKGCYFVTRQEVMYVMCKLKPRHKQSAFVKKEKNQWIWTHATQGGKRPW